MLDSGKNVAIAKQSGLLWRYDTQHNNTQHYDTEYQNTQHNDTHTYGDTQHNNSVIMLSVTLYYCYAECRYAECRVAFVTVIMQCVHFIYCYAECHYAE